MGLLWLSDLERAACVLWHLRHDGQSFNMMKIVKAPILQG